MESFIFITKPFLFKKTLLKVIFRVKYASQICNIRTVFIWIILYKRGLRIKRNIFVATIYQIMRAMKDLHFSVKKWRRSVLDHQIKDVFYIMVLYWKQVADQVNLLYELYKTVTLLTEFEIKTKINWDHKLPRRYYYMTKIKFHVWKFYLFDEAFFLSIRSTFLSSNKFPNI